MKTDVCGCKKSIRLGRRGACRSGDGGFTLVELVMVTAVIGALAALAIPAYYAFVEKARIARCEGDILAIQKDIVSYLVDHEDYPNSLNDVGRGALRDPFGNPYQYLKISSAPGTERQDQFLNSLNTSFDLYSMGKDGRTSRKLSDADSVDDIVVASDGAFLGPADKF